MQLLIDDFRPDIVQCHKLYPQLSVAPIAVAARAGIPIVQRAHDYEFLSPDETSTTRRRLKRGGVGQRALADVLYHLRQRRHIPRVDRFTVASDFVRAAYESAGLAATVVPNFIETQAAPRVPFRERAGVVFVGRLLEMKGAGELAECAALLSTDVSITAVGDGPFEPILRSAGIHCLGRLTRSEAMAVVSRARVAVVPSKWQEPAGNVALEAMAVGTPVVAYASGGLGEYVRGAGGVVVPPRPEALAATLANLYDDEVRWRAISASQTSRLRSYHHPERHIQQLVDLYETLMGQTNRGSLPRMGTR